MKKPAQEYTDEEIAARLDLAVRLENSLLQSGREPVLPDHLLAEKKELQQEQFRRQTGIAGEGI